MSNDLNDLIARRAEVKAQIELLNDALGVIDDQILQQLDVGTHDVDGVKVQIREYTRTDLAKIAKDFPADKYPNLYVAKVELDTNAVKAEFAPAALEAYKVTGKRSVVLS